MDCTPGGSRPTSREKTRRSAREPARIATGRIYGPALPAQPRRGGAPLDCPAASRAPPAPSRRAAVTSPRARWTRPRRKVRIAVACVDAHRAHIHPLSIRPVDPWIRRQRPDRASTPHRRAGRRDIVRERAMSACAGCSHSASVSARRRQPVASSGRVRIRSRRSRLHAIAGVRSRNAATKSSEKRHRPDHAADAANPAWQARRRDRRRLVTTGSDTNPTDQDRRWRRRRRRARETCRMAARTSCRHAA